KNDRIARDHQNWKPGGKSPVVGIHFAPVADAQRNDAAQQQPFVGDRIENRTQRAPLSVTARDVAIQSVSYGGDERNEDGGKELPLQRGAALNEIGRAHV